MSIKTRLQRLEARLRPRSPWCECGNGWTIREEGDESEGPAICERCGRLQRVILICESEVPGRNPGGDE